MSDNRDSEKTIGQRIREHWNSLTPGQRVLEIAVGCVVAAILGSIIGSSLGSLFRGIFIEQGNTEDFSDKFANM